MKVLPLILLTLVICLDSHAQQDCDTFLGSVTDLNNNCAPCTNGMAATLRPLLMHQLARERMEAQTKALDKYLDDKQSDINRRVTQQHYIDRILGEWGIRDLNTSPLITDPEYLRNTIENMREFIKLFPEQTEWIEMWMERFEELIQLLKEAETLTTRAGQLADRVRLDAFGNLTDLKFDCCPSAVEDGKFNPDQLDRLRNLESELKAFYDASEAYRSRLTDKASELTEILIAQLSQRAREEKEAIARRDEFANGVSGFLVSKMQSGMSTGIAQALQNAGYPVGSAEAAAIEAFSTAASNAAGAMGSGGGLGGVSGEAVQMIIETAMSNMSENDRRALGFVSNAVFSQIASAVVSQAIGNAITSPLGQFLFKGLEGAAIPVMLLDRMLTIAPYLWEDKNRMILQGGFDRILLGLVQGIRLCYATATHPQAGPLDAYIDELKGPKNRAIEICLPEQHFDPADASGMSRAFFRAAFPDQWVDSLSGNERFEVLQTIGKPYLLYVFNQKIRFHIRFGCYCGIMKEKIQITPRGIDPLWQNINLTGLHMKPGYPFVISVDKGFPWIPVGIGVAGAGVATYFLLQDDEAACDFSITTQVTNSNCGFDDGMATVIPSQPGNYTYVWSTGDRTATIAELEADSYSVTVTLGTGGCQRTANVLVPANPFLTDVTVSGAHCGANDGSASISVTPAAQYTYQWSNGANGPSQTNLSTGQYSITISLNGQCTQTSTITIPELAPMFTVNVMTTPAACGMSSGAASAVVNPPGNYNYTWSGGGTGPAISDLTPGDYTVTVTVPGASCEITATGTVTELPPDFIIDITATPAGCGVSNGSAQAMVTPAGTYTYLWSDGSEDEMLTDAAPGDYTVTVTIAGTDCQKSAMVTIGEMPPDFTIQLIATPADCGMNNGAVIAEALPPANYIYEWSTGDMTPSVTNLGAGEYSVTVSLPGSPQCSVTGTVEITENTGALNITITSTAATCGIADGTASVDVNPAGEYQYDWSTGAITQEVTELNAGNYLVTITDTNGCHKPVVLNVPVAGNPADYILNSSGIAGNCIGEGAGIVLELQTPGNGPMEIAATGPDGIHTVPASPGSVNLNTFFTVIPGTWQISVRDMSLDSTCNDQVEVQVDTISDLSGLDDMYETASNQPVNGNVLDNDLGTGLNVTDFTQPASGTVIVNPDGSFTYTPPAKAGIFTFTYTVTDTCGNSATPTVTITVALFECLFDAQFSTQSTDCGLNNGAIQTMLVPPGMYIFAWSNGDTTQDISNLTPGVYNVTITSIEMNCGKEYAIQVEEVPSTYIVSFSSSPGNCTGEGEIVIEITTPGAGPVVVVVDGPEGVQSFALAPGQYALSSLMNIPSGDYTITAYDTAAGEACAQMIEVTVDDDTVLPEAEDDDYTTPFETPLDGNVLDNDIGFDLTVVANSPATGGTVVISPDGSFTFTPDPGFSGTAEFSYVVADACGNEDDALVQIEVGAVSCDFATEFINTNASCGVADGSSQVVVDPPGNYTYAWSNGESTATISSVPAGMYTVTITDADLGCALSFDTEILENPPSYVSNILVTQPVCPDAGEIMFDVASGTPGPFDISVTHPNGVDVFTVPPGTVTLSDFIAITPGDYTISVTDQNAGPSCIDGFMATINAGTTPVIMLVSIVPPSAPSDMDGTATVTITTPGVSPYTILLNGLIYGLTTDLTFTVEGLGVGNYTVQIIDMNGCMSNILEFEVPLTMPFQLEFGTGLTGMMLTHPGAFPEQPRSVPQGFVMGSVFDARLQYVAGGLKYMTSVSLIFNAESRLVHDRRSIYRVSHSLELWEHRSDKIAMQMHAGLAMDLERNNPVRNRWLLRGTATKQLGKLLSLSGAIIVQGWERVEWPSVEIAVRMKILGRDVRI